MNYTLCVVEGRFGIMNLFSYSLEWKLKPDRFIDVHQSFCIDDVILCKDNDSFNCLWYLINLSWTFLTLKKVIPIFEKTWMYVLIMRTICCNVSQHKFLYKKQCHKQRNHLLCFIFSCKPKVRARV